MGAIRYAVKKDDKYLARELDEVRSPLDATLCVSQEDALDILNKAEKEFASHCVLDVVKFEFEMSILGTEKGGNDRKILFTPTEDRNRKFLPPPYDEYSVTTDGEVYTHKALTQKLSCFEGGEGYLQVELWNDNEREKAYVHNLVLRAFRGEPKEGEWARHLDGNRKNNRLDNLK